MDNERAIWKEQRRQKLFEIQKLKNQMDTLLHDIRVDLNPHVPIGQIKEDLVYDQAVRFKDSMILYRAKKAELASLDASLGIS